MPKAGPGGNDRAPNSLLLRKKAGKVEDFIPELVIKFVTRTLERGEFTVPAVDTFPAVAMFADLSGFTVMSESLATKGGLGAENLGFWLNRYFEQLVKLVAKAGGDVFKFAGDALIALWGPESGGPGRAGAAEGPAGGAVSGTPASAGPRSASPLNVEGMMRRAIQCALQIQSELHDAQFAKGAKFSIKIGIGVGDVNILYLGGMLDRMEYVTSGDALVQALKSEAECR
jgi:adenylate cyclase 10